MIRTLIIEDEKLAANKLERLLGKLTQSFQVVKRLTSLAEAIPYLSTNLEGVDLIFLDIHLGDGNCFEIFEKLDIEIPIIFTTAYDQYAIQAFQQNSVDYLLKPVTQDALAKAIEKYEKYFDKKNQTPLSIYYKEISELFQPKITPKKRFVVYVGAKIRSVNIEEVAYFYSEQGSTYLTTFEGKTYDINYTLEKLTPTLDSSTFYRINRKVIVQIEAIKEAYQFSKSKLKLELQPKSKFDVFVPLDKVVAFKNWLGR